MFLPSEKSGGGTVYHVGDKVVFKENANVYVVPLTISKTSKIIAAWFYLPKEIGDDVTGFNISAVPNEFQGILNTLCGNETGIVQGISITTKYISRPNLISIVGTYTRIDLYPSGGTFTLPNERNHDVGRMWNNVTSVTITFT